MYIFLITCISFFIQKSYYLKSFLSWIIRSYSPLNVLSSIKFQKIQTHPYPIESEYSNLLDLPELVVDSILQKLPPSDLYNMSLVCSSMRVRCLSNHLWEQHMREKWEKLMGRATCKGWLSNINNPGIISHRKRRIRSSMIFHIFPLSWILFEWRHTRQQNAPPKKNSIMFLYLALESGRFWFSAQVFNRENGHTGFMMSCYDAELSYDFYSDTFHARYPPHGIRATSIESGVPWERLRAPPLDTLPHELHVSDCLDELFPGDHIEIQWRRSKEFPYGWWYGVVGHLESCRAPNGHCNCSDNDDVVLEFSQYVPDSQWRRATINRKNHREEGNESIGFYGGIRKICLEEIHRWKQFWPSKFLE